MSRVPLEIEERVISRIRERRKIGRAKYGTSMERTDLPRADWLRHAQEEALDFAIYLERLIRDEAAYRASEQGNLHERNAKLKEALADALTLFESCDATASQWAAWDLRTRQLLKPDQPHPTNGDTPSCLP